MIHEDRSPPLGELLAVLAKHRVDFVVAGSCAALAHGVELEPGDLDIVPRISGSFAELSARAVDATLAGHALRALQRQQSEE